MPSIFFRMHQGQAEEFREFLLKWLSERQGIRREHIHEGLDDAKASWTYCARLPCGLVFMGRTYGVVEEGGETMSFYGHGEICLARLGPHPDAGVLAAALVASWCLPDGCKVGMMNGFAVLAVRERLDADCGERWAHLLERLVGDVGYVMSRLIAAGATPHLAGSSSVGSSGSQKNNCSEG